MRHDVMHRILIAPCMLCEGCYRISIVLWTDENDSNTLLVDTYFFANGREKISVLNGRGLKLLLFCRARCRDRRRS